MDGVSLGIHVCILTHFSRVSYFYTTFLQKCDTGLKWVNTLMPMGANGRLYSACMIVLMYRIKTCTVKENNKIRPERSDPSMIRWTCVARS